MSRVKETASNVNMSVLGVIQLFSKKKQLFNFK